MSTPLVTGLSPVYFSGIKRQVMRFVLDKTSGKVRAEQAKLSFLPVTDEKSMGESEQEAGEAQANELDGVAFLPADGTKWLVYDEEGQAHQFELDNRGILHESLAGQYAPMSRRYEPGKNLWMVESGKAGENVNLQKSALAHFPDRAEISQFFLDRKKSEEAHKAWRAALKDFPENSFVQFPPEPKVHEFVASPLKWELDLWLMNSRITPSQYSTPEAAYQDLWALRHQFFNLLQSSGSEKDLMKVAGDLYHYSAKTDLNSLFERKPFESDENFRDRCQNAKVEFALSCLDQSLSAIERKFPNEIAKIKAKLEAQGDETVSHLPPALDESLQMFLGEDGNYIQTVLDDTSISRDLKALYLKKAMTEEWPVFFESLDALYREDPSNIELISALKSIHDFCFNNEILIKMFEDSGPKIKNLLDHFFGSQNSSIDFQIRKALMAASKKMVEESIDSLLANSEEEKNESEPKSSQENALWRNEEQFHLTLEQRNFSEDFLWSKLEESLSPEAFNKEIKLIRFGWSQNFVLKKIEENLSSKNFDKVIRLTMVFPKIWRTFFESLSVEKKRDFFIQIFQAGRVDFILSVMGLSEETEAWRLIFQFLEYSNYSAQAPLPILKKKEVADSLERCMTLYKYREDCGGIFSKALRYGLPIDGRYYRGETLFHDLTKHSHSEVFVSLLEKNNISKEILEAKDDDQCTALHYVVIHGDEKAVLKLIEIGVDLNVLSGKNLHFKNSLGLALQFGHLKIADKLLAAGAVPMDEESILFMIKKEAKKFLSGLSFEQRTADKIHELFPFQEHLDKYGPENAERIKGMVISLAIGEKNSEEELWKDYQLKKFTPNTAPSVNEDKGEGTIFLTEVPSVLVAMRDYQPIHAEALGALIRILKSREKLNLNEVDEHGNTALGYCLNFHTGFPKSSEEFLLEENFNILTAVGAEFFPNFSPVKEYYVEARRGVSSFSIGPLSQHLAREFMNHHHPKIEDLDEKRIEEGVRAFFKVLLDSDDGESLCRWIQGDVRRIIKNQQMENQPSTSIVTRLYSYYSSFFQNKPDARDEKKSEGPPRNG